MYYTRKEMILCVFSIRLTTEEKSLAESYAKLHSMSLGEAFKKLYLKKSKRNTI